MKHHIKKIFYTKKIIIMKINIHYKEKCPRVVLRWQSPKAEITRIPKTAYKGAILK